MTTTLSEGVKVPDVGSVNWAGDLEVNWNLLNGALANLSGNVKTDRDNTWTGEQSFTLPIVGSITGTASKAIADEDGTNIKTGYGKLAGGQTWTGVNTFNSAPSIKGYASIINDSMALGTVPSSTLYNGYWFKGSTSDLIGSTDIEWYSSGNSAIVTRLTRNTAGASREIAYSFTFPQTGNGTFRVYGDCTPSVTNTYSLGSSSYQWSSVYAQTYYYNGAEFSSKFVTTDTTQTISGLKYFSSNILHKTPQTIDVSTIPAEDITGLGLHFVDNARYWGEIAPQWITDGTFRIRIAMTNYDTSGTGTGWFCPLVLDLAKDGSKIDIWSTHSNSNLGTSTNKWKTLNGINPGALSLPSSSYVDISGDITIRDGSASNSLTALCDGWIAICTFATWLQMSNDTLVMAVTGAIGTDGFSQAFLPVRKGDSIRIILNQTNTLFQSFKLIPCLGNV